ncbi:aldo/keto reductase [Bombella apis]|nr:aldo/keto reductase [Bombella apis]MUH03565.1 aldo/keto reductase [Bombella sp. ESL0387]
MPFPPSGTGLPCAHGGESARPCPREGYHMTTTPYPTVTLRNGITLPALGMGTWRMGDDAAQRAHEVHSLQSGLDSGLRIIDTAEMYGHGRSEEVVGEALRGRRDQAFLISKVLPGNATSRGTIEACERSLRHLNTDHLDLYLLHWPGSTPFTETLYAFETLKERGLIRDWGVSNFDTADMNDLAELGAYPLVNQILYSLEYRGTEYDLLPRDEQAHITSMAYCPIGQGGELLHHPALRAIAHQHETSLGRATPAQIALAWVLRRRNMIAIPKAGTPHHQALNIAAQEIRLSHDDLAALDEAFPPPDGKETLAVI